MKEIFKRIPVDKLVRDDSLQVRFALNEDAVETYREMFREGKEPPKLHVLPAREDGLHPILDGNHRWTAAKAEDVKELPCLIVDLPQDEALAAAYAANKDAQVRVSRSERDRVVVRLRTEHGMSQERIATNVGIGEATVRRILTTAGVAELDTRTTLSESEQRSLIRLLLKEEDQKSIATTFHISQPTVSNYKHRWFNEVLTAYQGGALKREVAEDKGLEPAEVDMVLRSFGDPLNFTPQEATFWPSFGIDSRFGQRHPGNIPAELVKNVLCRLTSPGDLVLDPFAGGGVVVDACADMVSRTCEAFDLTPAREDIQKWNILKGPPLVSRPPNLIFLDPPYGPQKEGEYSDSDDDLANMSVARFLKSMEKVFGYWDKGWLVCLMTVHTREGLGKYVHLPAKISEAMERTGWVFQERIVNQIGRAEGTNALSVSRLQKANEGRGWWSRRDDLDILIGRKQK